MPPASLTFPNRLAMLCQQAEHALSAAPRIPNASVATQAWQDEAWARRGCKNGGWESWGYPGENKLIFASQPAPVFSSQNPARAPLFPSPRTGIHCSPEWASPPPPTLLGAYLLLLPRCLHGLKIKTTATPRVPAWALESISYHMAGPSLDSQLELGEQTTTSSTGPGKSIERKCGWGQAPPTAPQFPGGPHPPAGWHSGWGSRDSDWKMKCE